MVAPTYEVATLETLARMIREVEARRAAGDREARLVITTVGNKEPKETLLHIAGNSAFEKQYQEYPT